MPLQAATSSTAMPSATDVMVRLLSRRAPGVAEAYTGVVARGGAAASLPLATTQVAILYRAVRPRRPRLAHGRARSAPRVFLHAPSRSPWQTRRRGSRAGASACPVGRGERAARIGVAGGGLTRRAATARWPQRLVDSLGDALAGACASSSSCRETLRPRGGAIHVRTSENRQAGHRAAPAPGRRDSTKSRGSLVHGAGALRLLH